MSNNLLLYTNTNVHSIPDGLAISDFDEDVHLMIDRIRKLQL